MKIGVLALQGAVQEHIDALARLGVEAQPVKWANEVESVDGLIIPGGESTAIAKLTESNPDPIFATIAGRIQDGLPVYGTCMGMIFLAKQIEGSHQGRLAVLDVKVRRNAFGPQKYSREQMTHIPVLGDRPFPLVFIRGPVILEAAPQVECLASIEEGIVMARQGNILVTAFHPELTGDLRVHQFFVDMVCNASMRQLVLCPA